MRARLLAAALAALALSGCKHAPDKPACDGSCLDVQVDRGGVGADIRAFQVTGTIGQGFTGHSAFGDKAGPSLEFPVYFTLRLGSRTGTLALTVAAVDATGIVVGNAQSSYVIAPGQRGSVKVSLVPGDVDAGPPADLLPGDDLAGVPDLALPPDLSGVEAGPPDLAMLARWRYANFFDPAQYPATDVNIDGVKGYAGVGPATVEPYSPLPPGQHQFDVHPAMNGMLTLAIAPGVQAPAPLLLTVYAVDQGCVGPGLAALTYTSTPTAGDAMHALINVVNAAPMPTMLSVAVDGMGQQMLGCGATHGFMVSGGGAMHDVVVYDAMGRTIAKVSTPPIANNEVWSVFLYHVAGPAPGMDGGVDGGAPGSDGGPDDAGVDAGGGDLGLGDLGMPDLAMPDLAMPDLAISALDLSLADLAMPDLLMPDLAVPPNDLSVPVDPTLRFLVVKDAP